MDPALKETPIDGNLIRQLRQQAEQAWQKQLSKCTQEKIWTSLNASIYDIHMLGISWKLKWIEQELDRRQQTNPPTV
jgi:hypothetical protein